MKILDIAFKDLTRSFRSAFSIGMMVVLPLLITGLIYAAFGGISTGKVDLPAVKVGLLNQDSLPAASLLSQSLGSNIRAMFLDDSVKSWIQAADYGDETSLRAALDRQEIEVAVIVPPDFSARFLGDQPDLAVGVIGDPTLTIGPQVVQTMVDSLLDGVRGGGIAYQTLKNRQPSASAAVAAAWIERYSAWYADFQRKLFHDPAQAAFVMVAPAANGQSEPPAQKVLGMVMAGMLIFFAFYTGAYAMMSILREDEEGTLARLFSTPTDRTAILAGKFLAVFVTVLLQGLVLIAASSLLFGIRWGSFTAISLALLGQVLAAGGLGVLLIAFVKTSRQGGPVLGGALTGLGMLGGLFTTNISTMPAAFNALANFTPQGWVLNTWQIVLNGQPAADLVVPLLALTGMGLVMFAAGAALFGRRYA